MNVLVLGGTGTIGGAVTEELHAEGAHVSVLARSIVSAARARELGAEPINGDIVEPEEWIDQLGRFDAVIHAASTFGSDMADTDRRLIVALLRHAPTGLRIVYTGGVWLFGSTGPHCGDDESALKPPEQFSWMVDGLVQLLAAPSVHVSIVHPGLVIASPDLPAPAMIVEEARRHEVVRTPVDASTRWPLVDRRDLARLYASVVDRGMAGRSYLGVSEPGVRAGDVIARLADRLDLHAPPEVFPLSYWQSEYGSWASCYALSQCLRATRARNELNWEPRWSFHRGGATGHPTA